MSNFAIVCHGEIREFSSFTLAAGQEVQLRGNFGAPLNYGTALAIWNALKSEPCVSDESLKRTITGYNPQPPLVGKREVSPDLNLQGDDGLLLFLINMGTSRYIRLGSDWNVRLSTLVNALGNSGGNGLWLNVMCCTELDKAGIIPPEGSHLVSNYSDIV